MHRNPIGASPRCWILLLLCHSPPLACALAANEITTTTATTITSAATVTSLSETACPSRTINYITHTLPQQCLKASRSAPAHAIRADNKDDVPNVKAPLILLPSPEHVQVKSGVAHGSKPHVENSSVAAAASSTPISQTEVEQDTDSPLDNANFLSFEEWKKKNLARADRSPENVGQARAASSESRTRQRPVDINALDALGEEAELELDFGGFGGPGTDRSGTNKPVVAAGELQPTTTSGEEDNVAPTSWALSKDAGKTCKERFNYASFDCAATVLKTNSRAKSSTAVLVENKDSYMLNECSAQNKFVIVELCDDILIDTVVLANYEFFSSMFRHFHVSASDRYPVKMDRWRTLGTFEARNSREIQPFLITEPQIWARYLRIEFVTHYGNEFYCPLSLLRVHGITPMEQFRREEEQARGDDDFAEPIEAADGDLVKTAAPPIETVEPVPIESLPVQHSVDAKIVEEERHVLERNSSQAANSAQSTGKAEHSNTSIDNTGQGRTQETQRPATNESDATVRHSEQTRISTAPLPSSAADKKTVPRVPASNGNRTQTVKPPATVSLETSPSLSSDPSAAKESAPDSTKANNRVVKVKGSSRNDTSTPTMKTASNSTVNTQSPSRVPTQAQPNPATPSTQESFFKSFHKRLQQLEMNSTLSLQYIEEQSRILRDAFMKVEKRQLSTTEKFLNHLNSTVMQELKSYRNMYDQLWQSTILELEGMKERQRSEVGEIGARLSMVAEELVWQKRMAVIQSTLLLLCLGLVLFVRSGSVGSAPDVPIMQQLGHKYSSFFESPPDSPRNPGGMRRKRTFRNMWRSDTSLGLSERSEHLSDGANLVSDDEIDSLLSPALVRSKGLTPTTPRATSNLSREASAIAAQTAQSNPASPECTGLLTPTEDFSAQYDDDDEAQRMEALATQSGPATPRGSRDSRPSWEEVERAVEMLKAEEESQAQAEKPLKEKRERRKKKKRSPLRRTESHDGTVEDPPSDSDNGAHLFLP